MAARRYEQRLRKDRAEDTRRRILEAATERLRRSPTKPVSLDDIARDARVSRSTIYLVFGSRAGLFDTVAQRVWAEGGFDKVVEAVQRPDAREHLRAGLRAGVEVFAEIRDVARALFSAGALDPDAVAGAIARIEENRAGGMAFLVQRLAEQEILRPDLTVDQATDLLWVLSSFEAFDLLYTGRKRSVDEIADLLIITAERALCR